MPPKKYAIFSYIYILEGKVGCSHGNAPFSLTSPSNAASPEIPPLMPLFYLVLNDN